MTVFFDWLSVVQVHADGCPVINDGYAIRAEKTGELRYSTAIGESVKGSWDTSVFVRSDGQRVEMSGNPSKWGRLEAVYGLTDMHACLAVFNGICRELGLPEFFEVPRHKGTLRTSDGSAVFEGVRILQVHLTSNYRCGSMAGAAAYLRWLSGQKAPGRGRVGAGYLYPDGMSVTWQSRRIYRKCYVKGNELRRHMPRLREVEAAYRERARRYLRSLAGWLDDQGVVRWEIELKSEEIKALNKERPSDWRRDEMKRVYEEKRIHGCGVGVADWQESTVNRLIAAGHKSTYAIRLRDVLQAWINGCEVGRGVSPRTVQRWARDLRVLGVDIRNQCNVVHLGVSVREVTVRELEVEQLPDWYRKEAEALRRLAA